MSGVCGYLCPSNRQAGEVVDAMLRRIAHRGPDGSATWRGADSTSAIGHVYLDAFAPASIGQPVADRAFLETDDLVVALDGSVFANPSLEIDPNLAAQVSPEVATVVAAYRADPEGWLGLLDGPFAVVLWDKRRHRLMVTRDRMGEKPMYYSEAGDGLLFASEIKAILAHPSYTRSLDAEGLSLLFAFGYVPGPATLFRGIRKLLPGQCVTWDAQRGVQVSRYWRIPRVSDGYEDEAASIKDSRDIFLEGLERYVGGCQDVGVYLSGGIDSSIITAGLAELGVPRIHTYSIGFHANPYNSQEQEDLSYAREVAAAFGATHHELLLTSGRDITHDLPRVLAHFDDLITTPNAYSKCLLLDVVKETGVKSTLTGLGSGAPFAFWKPSKLQNVLDSLRPARSDEEKYYRSHGRLFKPTEQAKFLKLPTVDDEQILEILSDYVGDLPPDSPPEEFLRRDPFYYAMITQAEKDVRGWEGACSLASVEVRSPFMYQGFLEYAARLPMSFDGEALVSSKTQLTKAYAPILPPSVIERKAIGYPSYYWTHGELDALRSRVFDRERIEAQGIFHYDGLRELIDSENLAKKSAGKMSFTVTQFAIWHDVHMHAGDEKGVLA